MILLRSLYVENYKLFSQKEFDFSNTLLTVFDGPNGYGKTSVFDAVELLITGKISRVLECESIDGKQSFKTVFFAQDNRKDVILKAEFEDVETSKKFALGARVKSGDINGKVANPKNIFNEIEWFYLPTADIPIDSWGMYIQNLDEIEEVRREKFGRQNIEQFTLFHYIRQEDRLSYFKQSETYRARTIESLLGVAKETDQYIKVLEKRKSVDKIYKQISKEIDLKRKLVVETDDLNYTIEYEPLLSGEQIWDRESVSFGNSNQEKILEKYFAELDRIESYVKFFSLHKIYFSYKSFIDIPEKMRSESLRALILLHKSQITIDVLDIYFHNLKFLKEEKDKIQSQDYHVLNLPKINKILGASEDKSLALGIDKLGEISRNQGELQKVLTNVIKMRDNFHRSYIQLEDNGICPYCGHDWKSQVELEKQFASTKMTLQKLLTRDGELYAKQIEKIRGQIEKGVLKSMNNKIDELSKMNIIGIYESFGNKENFITSIEKARSIFNISSSQLASKGIELKDNNEYLRMLIDECINIGNKIPIEYISANKKYNFSEIRKKYPINSEQVYQLNKERLDKKRQYIQEQFYRSFDEIKEYIKNLEMKKKAIEELQFQIKEYEKAIKSAIGMYKKQVIDEIEIPFFVYSSRLLQSYHGGQGILMKNDGGSIRFTSPGNEHDVLYTMSSGQLSAVLLSFSLALNKIYSGNELNMLLVDDPIQCMDDINMISFVELLRREFSGCQIFLSTHEEDFSNYVRYKFKKYGLDTQAITLKDV